jgi:hypothetical protein
MSIIGYASATSVLPGETLGLHLGATGTSAESRNLSIARLGTPATSDTLAVTVADRTPPATRPWEGYGWPRSDNFLVPSTWPTGLYRVGYEENGNWRDILGFVVRHPTPGSRSTILLHISFLTPQAYDRAGGKSLYDSNPGSGMSDRASVVSFDRPWSAWHWLRERDLIAWLEGGGTPLEYCSSIDLHADPTLLANYDCLVLAYHDEYWTKEMYDNVECFVVGGGNVICLSGNTCFRQVRLELGNRRVVFHKYASADPNPDSQRTTVAWADPPVNRPPNRLLGAGFTDGAVDGPRTAYQLHFPGHWALAGVSATSTPAFMYFETDAAEFVVEPEGYPRVTGAEGTPLSFTILGSADLRSWGSKPGMATMGVYWRNGTVFHAGTTDWIEHIGDPTIARITTNVVNRLRTRRDWDWELIGHASAGSALAAVGGKLYIATVRDRLWRRYPVGADVPWTDVGHANGVIAMAGSRDTLFCVTNDNTLWSRPAADREIGWTRIGSGPDAGTRALAAVGGLLYAVDTAGELWCRNGPPTAALQWRPLSARPSPQLPRFTGRRPEIRAMTSYSDILFASTTDNRLLRTNRDWIWEATDWTDIHHCNFSIGLAVIDGMLFVATSEDGLWQLSLHGLRQP